MSFENRELLVASAGDAGGALPPTADLDAADAWVQVRRSADGSSVRPSVLDAPVPAAGVCGGRFWALAEVESDKEDGVPSPRLGAPSSRATLGDFVL